MTRLPVAIAPVLLAALLSACGSKTAEPGVDPETALSEATERTVAEETAHVHYYGRVKGRPVRNWPGWDTRGDISFTKREARLMEADELSIYKPSEWFVRNPLAEAFGPGKKWIRFPREVGPSGWDDRIRLLVYLTAGVTRMAKPDQSELAGVETLHYDSNVDVGQALKAVQEETRELAQDALQSTLLGKTGRVEFWIDQQGRLRRIQVTVPPGRSYSYSGPDGSEKKLESGPSTLIGTLDYTDFGVEVDATPPPADEVGEPGG